MSLLESYDGFQMMLLCTLLPSVFAFLWSLIFGDFKNFVGSKKAYSVFTASDPVNCYQNYTEKKTD